MSASTSKEQSPIKGDNEMSSLSVYSNPSYKEDDSEHTDSMPASPTMTETPFIATKASKPGLDSNRNKYKETTENTDGVASDDSSSVIRSNSKPNPSAAAAGAVEPPSYDKVAVAYDTSVAVEDDAVVVTMPPSSTSIHDEAQDSTHRELVLKTRKTMPLKDFGDEVRARRDLQRFLGKPTVVLDVPHIKLYQIVDELLKKLRTDLDMDEKITAQAAKRFFTFQNEYQDSFESVDQLRETIQGVEYRPDHTNFEQTWVTTVCSLPNLKKSHVAIARLRSPVNLGTHCEEVKFVVAVIAPQKEKFTKNAVEIGRTFSSLLSDCQFRARLHDSADEKEFKQVFQSYLIGQDKKNDSKAGPTADETENTFESYSWKQVGRGVYDDLKRRWPHYKSDYVDGVIGKNTISKLLATVLFLYFACLLPDIAFGTLYQESTDGKLNVFTCILSQTIGGLAFAIFGGQPLLIMLTTAPLALYVKVIKMISDTFKLNFSAMYMMVGVWNAIFLVLEAVFNLSLLMKYSTRSTEEIFGFFIALAFSADAIKAAMTNFKLNYHFPPSVPTTNASLLMQYAGETCDAAANKCYRPENSLLFLVLMLGTLWLGITLLKFDQSPYLSARKREILADYALPISVVFFSFLGSYAFQSVKSEPFYYDPDKGFELKVPDVSSLTAGAHFAAMGLGLCLSCLFFVDQNVSAAFVNAPQNKLRKGSAYHWDLVVVAIINSFLSIFNLPWVHAALPHSPLHVRALADVEQHVTNVGTVHDEIVKVRETRLTGIISHVLIGFSLLFVSFLQYIPVSVLQGLFLYLGLSSFIGNQMFERLLLFFTEESSYPPTHYVRKVPQRQIHVFTAIQCFQLIVVSIFGFADLYYLKMIFPVIILLLLPVRHIVLPKFVEKKYLNILDC